jgi:hypothetical protein
MMIAFWDIALYSLVVDVSEVHNASIIRAMNKPHAKNQLEIK